MEKKKLYLGNLNYSATSEEVRALLSEYANVTNVNIIEEKGFGFAEFETQEDAEKALNELNGKEFKGRTLKIDFANPPKKNFRPAGAGFAGNRGGDRGGFRRA